MLETIDSWFLIIIDESCKTYKNLENEQWKMKMIYILKYILKKSYIHGINK